MERIIISTHELNYTATHVVDLRTLMDRITFFVLLRAEYRFRRGQTHRFRLELNNGTRGRQNGGNVFFYHVIISPLTSHQGSFSSFLPSTGDDAKITSENILLGTNTLIHTHLHEHAH